MRFHVCRSVLSARPVPAESALFVAPLVFLILFRVCLGRSVFRVCFFPHKFLVSMCLWPDHQCVSYVFKCVSLCVAPDQWCSFVVKSSVEHMYVRTYISWCVRTCPGKGAEGVRRRLEPRGVRRAELLAWRCGSGACAQGHWVA